MTMGRIGGWNEFGTYEHAQNNYGVGDFSDIESDGEEACNATRIKHDYRDETWKQDQFTYDMKP
jgi:hypothetical protein